jgi:hypothetical protein
MSFKLEVNTKDIVNNCALHAKHSGSKISAYYLTLNRATVEAFGMQDKDKVDIAVLSVNHQANNGTPKIEGPEDLAADVETGRLVEPVVRDLTPEAQQALSTRSAKKKGRRGISKRGKRGPRKKTQSGKRSKRAKA